MNEGDYFDLEVIEENLRLHYARNGFDVPGEIVPAIAKEILKINRDSYEGILSKEAALEAANVFLAPTPDTIQCIKGEMKFSADNDYSPLKANDEKHYLANFFLPFRHIIAEDLVGKIFPPGEDRAKFLMNYNDNYFPYFLQEFINSEVVYWEFPIWKMATNGCQEAFLDQPIFNEVADVPSQYWTFNKDIEFPVDILRALFLPDYYVLTGAFILKYQPASERFAKAIPDGFRELSLEKPSIQPYLIFSPDAANPATVEAFKRGPMHYIPRIRPSERLVGGERASLNDCSFVAARYFLESEIGALDPVVFPRGDRRRAKKAGQPEPVVKKVILRRRKPSQGQPHEGPVEWSCQWMVRPHWRRNHRDAAKPIFVSSYVKGPEDKPLKQPTQTIYHVAR